MKSKIKFGFSLIELIIVIAISAFLITIAGVLFDSGFRAIFNSNALNNSVASTRIALTRMHRELAQIRSNTDTDLSISTEYEIRFTDTNNHQIHYWLQGSTLMRNSQPMADNIKSLVFTYLTADARNSTNNVNNISIIVSNIEVVGEGFNYTWRNTVYPRQFLSL